MKQPGTPDLFSAVLNQKTAPSGQSQRCQKSESMQIDISTLAIAAVEPTITAIGRDSCRLASSCSPIRASSGAKSHLTTTCTHPSGSKIPAVYVSEMCQPFANAVSLDDCSLTGKPYDDACLLS